MITGRNGVLAYNGDLLAVASTMAWAENFLNHTNGYYEVGGSEGEYLVPFPPGYTSTMKAHWTTDVIVINPSCSWETVTTTIFDNSGWEGTLSKSNLSIGLRNESFCMFFLSFNALMCLIIFSIER